MASRSGDESFEAACGRAMLAGLAGAPGSGVSAADGQAEADRAMGLLHRAIAMGFRARDAIRTEPALGPIRDRDDFRLMMMDLDFPDHPLGPAR